MLDFGKLKKIISGNKPCNEEHLKQFNDKLKEEKTKTLVVNEIPKLLPAVLKYAFHENAKFREAAVPAFIELTNLLDLNKHLKEKPWWSEMKESITKNMDILMQLVVSADKNWSVLWSTTVNLFGTDLRNELTILNKLLKVVEKAFKLNDENVRCFGFECWSKLIDNFAINRQELNNKRRLNLLIIPLKANNHTTKRLCECKMKTWKHLLSKLDQHNEMTVQLSIPPFLEFMFAGVSLPPVCQTLNTDCANVLEQLLKAPVLFRILPERFIKYTFICIEHIFEDLPLSLNLWESLLGNLKNFHWAENSVTDLMTGLTNAAHSDKFGKSKTFAHMVHALYSGTNAMDTGLLVNHCQTLISIALEPQVLSNFSEPWCSDLFDVIAKTDPILLPQNILSDVVRHLTVLSASECFRNDKLKLLRGLWVTITNIVCKWMTDNGQIGRNGSLQTDMHNTHLLLMFGVADLSSMWNKFQMKTWKTLYSECVKYFSLLPEANTDKYVKDLIDLLHEGVCSKRVPLHVAVDLVCIVLEFNLSKDSTSILPLMTDIAESTMISLQHDASNAPTLLNHYLKSIVAAARSDPALVIDILSVVNHLFKSIDTVPLCVREKIQNTVLKAQHQLQTLKPTRTQDKNNSPGSSQAPPASSPVTSFMHRLAKAKESKAKIGSPTPTHSSDMSSSPVHTPTSKKAISPFADLKSEEFVFVPPKTRKTILTDHQKESLRTRKHDIPALYQDLSQDSSQSAFESIVTSVQTIEEDVANVRVLRSPKKINDSLEIALKVSTPKKIPADSSLKTKMIPDKTEGLLTSNKENDCFNNNKNSPFSSVTKQDNHELDQDHTQNCAASPVSTKPKLQSKIPRTKKDLTQSFGNSDKSDISKRDNEDINESEGHENLESSLSCDASSSVKGNISGQLSTPKRNLRKNKLIKAAKQSLNKEYKKNSDNSKYDLTPPSIKVKSPDSVGSAKISPRRLRKRKSGVTPILSGGKFVKKKNLSLSHSPVSDKETPKSIKRSTPNVLSDENKKSKTATCVNKKNKVSVSCNSSIAEPSLPTDESEYPNTESKAGKKLNVSENKTEKLLQDKEPAYSPVKLVLTRLPNNAQYEENLHFAANTVDPCVSISEKEKTTTTSKPVDPVIVDLESEVKNFTGVLNMEPEESHPHEIKKNKSLASVKSSITPVPKEDQYETKNDQKLRVSPTQGKKTPHSKHGTSHLISDENTAERKSGADIISKKDITIPCIDLASESSLSTDESESNENHITLSAENKTNTSEKVTEKIPPGKEAICNVKCSPVKVILSRLPDISQCKRYLSLEVNDGDPFNNLSSKKQKTIDKAADSVITELKKSSEKSPVKNLTTISDLEPEESLAQNTNSKKKTVTDKTKVSCLSKSEDQLQNKQGLSGDVSVTDKITVLKKSLVDEQLLPPIVETRSSPRGKVSILTDNTSVTDISNSSIEKLHLDSNSSDVSNHKSQAILGSQMSSSNSLLLRSMTKLEKPNSVQETDSQEPTVQNSSNLEKQILNKEKMSTTTARTTRSMESTNNCAENKHTLPKICESSKKSSVKEQKISKKINLSVTNKVEIQNELPVEDVSGLENLMAQASSSVLDQGVPKDKSASCSIKTKSLELSKNISDNAHIAPQDENDSPKIDSNIKKSPVKEQNVQVDRTLQEIMDSAHESMNDNLMPDILIKDKDEMCEIEKTSLIDIKNSNISSPEKKRKLSLQQTFANSLPGKCSTNQDNQLCQDKSLNLLDCHLTESQCAEKTELEDFVILNAKSEMHSAWNSSEESAKKTALETSLSKQVASVNTPMKSGQKHFKQTQLPFTPIQKLTKPDTDRFEKSKSIDKESKNDEKNSTKLSVDANDKLLQDCIKNKSPFLVITKLATSEESNKYSSSNTQNELSNTGIKTVEVKNYGSTNDSSVEARESHSIEANKSEKQNENERPNICDEKESSPLLELPRTPEKHDDSQDIIEIGPSEECITESPTAETESEDIIASSQESVHSSIILDRSSAHGSKSPFKMLSKSPKKLESDSFSQFSCNSDRQGQNLRFCSTPVKKSVCRRLDVEINDKPVHVCQSVRDDQGISLENKSKVITQFGHGTSSEELLNDIKLLNGDINAGQVENSGGANVENFTSSHKLEIESKSLEENQSRSSNINSSPKNINSLKRFLLEPNSNCTESPKSSLSQLRLEGAGSPSSRTNQMMELAMQEKEKTVSSPVSSVKKRRIHPLRLGPVVKTPQSQSGCTAVRTHNGPSEEWVRRTYSPSASPNSSILKRKCETQPTSPDCSPPPSAKKKRVSFLDPPVSESLLFSKANPGKGQIQRPEAKQETESEDLPSQGSVQVTPSTSSSESNIFQPLKLCPHPITDILERIVSVQWSHELESQLERLGVTTIGQLSSLTETTVERLPFIPPKLERLRKILQNYYNEINEKPVGAKQDLQPVNNEECATPSDEVNHKHSESFEEKEMSKLSIDEPCSAESVSSFADNIKSEIEKHPDLISELGSKLDVEVIMSILRFAVTKLKDQSDKR